MGNPSGSEGLTSEMSAAAAALPADPSLTQLLHGVNQPMQKAPAEGNEQGTNPGLPAQYPSSWLLPTHTVILPAYINPRGLCALSGKWLIPVSPGRLSVPSCHPQNPLCCLIPLLLGLDEPCWPHEVTLALFAAPLPFLSPLAFYLGFVFRMLVFFPSDPHESGFNASPSEPKPHILAFGTLTPTSEDPLG